LITYIRQAEKCDFPIKHFQWIEPALSFKKYDPQASWMLMPLKKGKIPIAF
jgi:hypothetical protein